VTEIQSRIYYEGEQYDSWPCDTNPITGEMESNGCVEVIILHKEKAYSFLCDWGGKPVKYNGAWKGYRHDNKKKIDKRP